MTQVEMEVLIGMTKRAISLDQLLCDVITDAINAGIPVDPNIEKQVYIDYNTPERVGFCNMCLMKYEIHIADKLLKADQKYIKDVLAHEVLHTCFLAKNHYWPWNEYAETMNKTYGYHIKEKYKSWVELGVI